ncbi:ribosomal protein S36 [Acetobacter pasteurianus]|nr:ribosomal protein S36 [Acetobacter pasteurianus]
MRVSSRLLKHTIKFVGGPHPIPKQPHAAKIHPLAPEGLIPGSVGSSSGSHSSTQTRSYHNSNPIQPKEGEFFSRSELPQRFRYKPIKDFEIDNVQSGGADIIY